MKKMLAVLMMLTMLFTNVSPVLASIGNDAKGVREVLSQSEMMADVGANSQGALSVEILAPAGNDPIVGGSVSLPVKYAAVVTNMGNNYPVVTVTVFNSQGTNIWQTPQSSVYALPGQCTLVNGTIPDGILTSGATDLVIQVTALNPNGKIKATASTQFNVY